MRKDGCTTAIPFARNLWCVNTIRLVTRLDFEFTGLDAFPEAQAARKEIDKQEKKQTPYFLAILTAFGVDPVSGEVWMALHNTLLHFDKEGNRRSEYQIYTREERGWKRTPFGGGNRLLIGADPQGVFDFERRTENTEDCWRFPQGCLHNFSALQSAAKKIPRKCAEKREILVLAQKPVLVKSCECHVNGGATLRTFFACSITDSARESIPVS